MTLRWEIWPHTTNLTPPFSIEMPVPRQESELSCICVFGVSILPLSTIFVFNFRTVQTVWYYYFRTVQTVWYYYFATVQTV